MRNINSASYSELEELLNDARERIDFLESEMVDRTDDHINEVIELEEELERVYRQRNKYASRVKALKAKVRKDARAKINYYINGYIDARNNYFKRY